MGMFDYVEFQTKCPTCGEILTGFQSKDGECIMTTIPYWEVDHFYTSCWNCRTWVDFRRKKPVGKPYVPISDYTLEYHKLEGKDDNSK